MKRPNDRIDIPKLPGMMFHMSFDPPKEFIPEIEIFFECKNHDSSFDTT